jgi:hypothetical protein
VRRARHAVLAWRSEAAAGASLAPWPRAEEESLISPAQRPHVVHAPTNTNSGGGGHAEHYEYLLRKSASAPSRSATTNASDESAAAMLRALLPSGAKQQHHREASNDVAPSGAKQQQQHREARLVSRDGVSHQDLVSSPLRRNGHSPPPRGAPAAGSSRNDVSRIRIWSLHH